MVVSPTNPMAQAAARHNDCKTAEFYPTVLYVRPPQQARQKWLLFPPQIHAFLTILRPDGHILQSRYSSPIYWAVRTKRPVHPGSFPDDFQEKNLIV